MSLPEVSISLPYGIPSTSRPLPNMITTRNNVIESPISRAGGGNDGHDDDDVLQFMLHILGISAIYSIFLLSGGGQILTIIFLKELPELFSG